MSETAEAPWVQMWGGGSLCLANPVITDLWPLVRAIAGLRRFNGHTKFPIWVTQHSVAVAWECTGAARPYGLLHDLHEGVIGDIPTPVKRMLGFEQGGALDALADRLDAAIWKAVGLPPPDEAIRAEVRRADVAVLMAERRDAMHIGTRDWGALESATIAPCPVRPMSEQAALRLFMRELTAFLWGRVHPGMLEVHTALALVSGYFAEERV